MSSSAALLEQMRHKLDQIEQANRAAEKRAAGYPAMNRELAELEATAQSPDGAVTVVAGASGVIKSISFTEDALRQDAGRLSKAVMSTLQQALADAARQQAAVVQNYVGDDIAIVERVRKTQEQIFGTTGRGNPKRRDDDMENHTILRTEDPR